LISITSSCWTGGQDPLDDLHGLGVRDRMPCTNWDFLPTRSSASSICATAVHHDRLHAHQLEQYHVVAKLSFSGRSVIALPPYFTTIVRP